MADNAMTDLFELSTSPTPEDIPTRRITVNDLETPAFIVNRHAFRRNCEMVRTAAYANGITRLRPHVKTHKTKEGCLIQAGIFGKVSSCDVETLLNTLGGEQASEGELQPTV